ncbi:MAG TPA: hypothetical protein ENK19_07345 [Acidobacteria bacterium]|nr:hypothetical protein [Acidobacteriota bacterium]
MSRRAHADPPAFLDRLVALALPTAAQTLLLRTCLLEPGAAREAFAEWIRITGGSVERLAAGPDGARSLGPVLWAALRDDPAGPRPVQTYLRAAAAREQARAKVYGALCREVFDALETAGVPFLVLKGALLAWSVYGEPWHRHCHDLDLLVRPEDMSRAVRAVAEAGFTGADPAARRPEAVHPSGLPVVLHPAPHPAPHYNRGMEALWREASPRTVAGCRVLAPPEHEILLHVLVHAVTGSHRNGLLWATDAGSLLARHPGLDWDAFVARARESGAAVLLSPSLEFLGRELAAPVPPGVIDALGRTAATPLDRSTAILRISRTSGLGRCLAAAGGPAAAALLVRMAFPPPRALLAAGEAATPSERAAAYPRRIVGGVHRLVRRHRAARAG